MNTKLSYQPKGITLGIPTFGRPVTLEWAVSFKNLTAPINYNTVMTIINNKPVDLARNELVHYAREQKHKYIFMLGDDVVVPYNILKQLIYRAENNNGHGIITGVYCSKSRPPAPLLFRGNGVGSYWKWKVGEYFEISGCGMDAVLIDIRVFEELEGYVNTDAQGLPQFFRTIDTDEFEENVNYAEMWTEDLYFLDLVKKHTDYKIYCDGEMLCDHVNSNTGEVFRLPGDSYPITGIEATSGKGLKKGLDVGAGGMDVAFPGYKMVTVDIREDVNPDYRCDIRHLPFDNNSFDLVYNSHVLEHFGRWECKDLLKEWLRVLKPGGTLKTIVPNIDWALQAFEEKKALKPEFKHHVYNVLYGGQTNDYDYHKNGWNEETLNLTLRELGLVNIKFEKKGYNLYADAEKEK